ncbi:hypothetical protein PISMIDRAFT_9521 [Pisolithus microcarpus 441]|uniref:Uncharacterized protein n=1 Tax=Pisolithus microcarpus 441 TaxID=765257 RepID=A0A0D0A0D3_9AGAM|nr:hypothetical protein BKA83DRAFT_9521 [Pisolithus microcarpus]KIK25488.1 hypothetical protein PISMIDRAFT_9521 [Pisolithus microcarpus 441]
MPLDFRSFDSAEARSHHGLNVLVANAGTFVQEYTEKLFNYLYGVTEHSDAPAPRQGLEFGIPLASGCGLQLRSPFQRGEVEERGAVRGIAEQQSTRRIIPLPKPPPLSETLSVPITVADRSEDIKDVPTADANTDTFFPLAEDKDALLAVVTVAKLHDPTRLWYNRQCTSDISFADVDEVDSPTAEAPSSPTIDSAKYT